MRKLRLVSEVGNPDAIETEVEMTDKPIKDPRHQKTPPTRDLVDRINGLEAQLGIERDRLNIQRDRINALSGAVDVLLDTQRAHQQRIMELERRR